MPIVIMPNGEMVDSVTGNPVDTPRPMPNNMGEFIANRPMRQITGASIAPQELMMEAERRTGSALTDMEKVQMLMDMGLREDEAVQAVAMEKQLPAVEPQDFTGQTGAMLSPEEMGALGALPTPRGNVSTAMGMPEDAMVNQMLNQGDTSGMSPQQIEMLRMGIDPFAEGMIAPSDSRGGVPSQEYMPADMRRTRRVIY